MAEWLGLPILASEHGGAIDSALFMVHVIMAVAFLLWTVFFIIPLFKFRKKKHPKADYNGLRTKLPYVPVLLLAVIELYLLFFVSLPFWEEHVNASPEFDEDALKVRIVGQQFRWSAHYPGKDGIFGRTAPEFVNSQTNIMGLDPNDPNGDDDITTMAPMHLPVDTPVVAYVSSKDVIHSFAVPEFRVKQDAIPGMRIPVRFTPNMTTAELRDKTGVEDRDFQIMCAQLCGLGHYQMVGYIVVESQEEFDAWMAEEIKRREEAAEFDDFWAE